MAAELDAADMCTVLVVVLVSECYTVHGADWMPIDCLHGSEAAELGIVAKARVQSFMDKPHSHGPLEVQLRSAIQKRWSSSHKRNRYGQIITDRAQWRIGKTAVIKIAPNTVGE